jgi:hypothetical protein
MLLGFTFPDLETGDVVALDNAIRPYLDRCRREIAAGNTYPFKGDLERLTRLQEAIVASQRVRVSGCTPADADLYLGDEVSAETEAEK